MNNTSARDALVEQIKKSSNILVALNANPTIDELASALGLTLILNKTSAHVTTIFSGAIPEALNFLKPDTVFDQTVDGLRDFIIALDPAKADYVRTKVVDGMVRVSITPSKAAVTVDDLEFSQGDYNVDLVIALGVKNQDDLDQALQAHGRILHNAFVASIGIGSASSEIGNLNWQEPAVQSYAQIVADLTLSLEPRKDDDKPNNGVIIDSAVATALMTALVAVTERFSNSSTTPEIMSLAAVLMEQGADQQLISSELEAAKKAAEQVPQDIEPLSKMENTDAQSTDEPASEPEARFDQTAKIDHSEETDEDDPDELKNNAVAKIDQIIDQIAETDKDLLSEPVVNTQKLEISANETNEASDEPKNDSVKIDETPTEPQAKVEPSAQVASEQIPASQPSTDEPELVLPEIKTPPRKITKDSESWDKVNQFKQAFMNRMKESQKQKGMKVSETIPETSEASEASAPLNDIPEAEKTSTEAKKPTTSIRSERLKKKPAKVIQPPEHKPEPGPTVGERIEQELQQVAPPLPTMPLDMPMPPMPPLPPEFDPITMTSLPPMGQPDFANSPFNALEQAPEAQPVQPSTSPQPSTPVQPEAVTPPVAAAPQPNPQLLNQPGSTMLIRPDITEADPDRVPPENQFVIPE